MISAAPGEQGRTETGRGAVLTLALEFHNFVESGANSAHDCVLPATLDGLSRICHKVLQPVVEDNATTACGQA